MKILYVLPRQDYFAWGPCGRVTHALGVAAGVTKAGATLVVASGSGLIESLRHIPQISCVEVSPVPGVAARHRWAARLAGRIAQLLESDATIDAIVVRYAVSNAHLFAALMRRFRGKRWCFEVNSLAYHHLTQLPPAVRRFIARVETQRLNAAGLLYVVSAALREDLLRSRPELESRIVVIPNGGPDLDEPLVRTGGPDPASGGPVRFLYLGVLQPYYEYEVVLRAFAQMRSNGIDAELQFHGYGAGYERLARMIGGFPGASLHGRYQLNQLIATEVVNARCVLLVPCRTEGSSLIVSPIKLFEYMSMGLPIIASSAGQAPHILRHGETGLVYRAGDPESCAKMMSELAMNAALRHRMSVSTWNDYRKRHTWSVRMADLLRALEFPER